MEGYDDLYSQLVSATNPHYQWLGNGKDFNPIQLAEQLYQNSRQGPETSTASAPHLLEGAQEVEGQQTETQPGEASGTVQEEVVQAETQQEDKTVKPGMYCMSYHIMNVYESDNV